MATHCLIPLLGKMLRVTELDACGAPKTGGNFIATDGFVSITLSSEVEDGTEIIVRKANGSLCVNEKQADSFKRFTVELHLCGVNPSLLGIMSNAEPYYASTGTTGDVIGFTVPEGEISKWFSLELWTGLSGQACAPGTEEASGYILLPFVTAGVLGDLEIGGEDAIDFSITGAATKGGNQWGTGPFNVVKAASGGTAAKLPVAVDAFDHLLMIDTALAPPPSACDPKPLSGVTTFVDFLRNGVTGLGVPETIEVTVDAPTEYDTTLTHSGGDVESATETITLTAADGSPLLDSDVTYETQDTGVWERVAFTPTSDGAGLVATETFPIPRGLDATSNVRITIHRPVDVRGVSDIQSDDGQSVAHAEYLFTVTAADDADTGGGDSEVEVQPTGDTDTDTVTIPDGTDSDNAAPPEPPAAKSRTRAKV